MSQIIKNNDVLKYLRTNIWWVKTYTLFSGLLSNLEHQNTVSFAQLLYVNTAAPVIIDTWRISHLLGENVLYLYFSGFLC